MKTPRTAQAAPTGGSLSDILTAMRRAVVDGEFAAGSRITERQVSERFGCTAATVREVFHLLEKAGTITLSARRGARVVDSATAPPDDLFAVWRCMRDLATSELAAAPPLAAWAARPEMSRSQRLEAIERRAAVIGQAAASPRLGEILSRLAMHVAIVAPGRLGDIEASLAR